METNFSTLYGQGVDHLIPIPSQEDHRLHRAILKSWNELKAIAKGQGIDLAVISSFRSFENQKYIWNLKATGQRELLDDRELPIPFSNFNLKNAEDQLRLVQTIMRWSALPGLSRHHWGTDLDVIDKLAIHQDPNYKVQLISSEYQRGGIFQKLGAFLNSHLADTDFFRPYSKDLGGVAPEPWHISHRAQSNQFLRQLSSEHYRKFLHKQSDSIELSATISENITDIFERFVLNIED